MNQSQAEKDLEFIKQIIEDSRSFLISQGFYLIIWGLISLFCIILTYGATFLKLFNFIYLIWGGFFLIGGFINFYIIRKYKKAQIKSLTGKIYGSVWIGSLIFLAVITISIIISGKYSINLLLSIVSGVLGMGYFITSTISRNRWMFVLSFVWWTGCFILIFINRFYAPLVLCGLIITCELIPGMVLLIKSKKINHDKTVDE